MAGGRAVLSVGRSVGTRAEMTACLMAEPRAVLKAANLGPQTVAQRAAWSDQLLAGTRVAMKVASMAEMRAAASVGLSASQ